MRKDCGQLPFDFPKTGTVLFMPMDYYAYLPGKFYMSFPIN